MKKALSLILSLALVLLLCPAGFAENPGGDISGDNIDPYVPLTDEYNLPEASTDAYVPPEETVPSTALSEETVPPPAASEETVPPPAPSEETVPPPAPSEETVPPPAPSEETVPPPAASEETVPPPAPSEETVPPPAPSEETVPPPAPSEETAPPTAPSEETAPPTVPSEETTPPTTLPPETAPPTTPPPETTIPIIPPVTESRAITKHPTAERVQEGGFAQFVARADNCTNIIWHLQSPSGDDMLAQYAPLSFPGLEVSGLGSERLTLNKIPADLDGWRVRAEFVYLSGNSWSNAAAIYVISQGLVTPTIQSQPESASLEEGQSTILQVDAQSTGANVTLTYQWYQNNMDSNVRGKAILGATDPTYSPEAIPGTVYYYCAVRSSDGTDISSPAMTACAAVSYPAAPTETTTASVAVQPTSPSAAASTSPSAATLTTWGTAPAQTPQAMSEAQNQVSQEPATVPITVPPATAPTRVMARTNPLLAVIIAVIVVIALVGVIAAVLILRYYSDRKPAPRSRKAKSVQPPRQPLSREDDPEWDDLSDLDLSYYLDDEDDL